MLLRRDPEMPSQEAAVATEIGAPISRAYAAQASRDLRAAAADPEVATRVALGGHVPETCALQALPNRGRLVVSVFQRQPRARAQMRASTGDDVRQALQAVGTVRQSVARLVSEVRQVRVVRGHVRRIADDQVVALGLRRWVSALLAAWFMVSPATVLCENLYFYTYVVALLLVLSALALSKFLETDNFWWGLSFVSLLACLCLTWAIFHLAWMIAVIALAAVFSRDRRRLVLASLVPVLIVSGWYAKNGLQFGSFGASSWTGMNLSHVTFLSPLTPQSVREELVKQGELTPYPVMEAFRPIESYQGLL